MKDFTRQLLLPSHCKLFYPHPSLGLQILKKNFPINQNALFPEILHARILFLFIQLGSKVLGLSVVQIKSEIKRHYLLNQIMKLDM